MRVAPAPPAQWTAMIRRRVHRLSLRSRLTAVLVGLLFLSCAILTVVTSLALHAYLVHRLDQQLASAGNRYAVSLEHPSDHDADNNYSSVVGQASGTLGARISAGQVTAAGIVTDESTTSSISAADRAVIAQLQLGGARDVRLPTLGEYRIIVTAGADNDLQVTGLPKRGVDDTIARLTLIEVIVFIVALALTALAGAICVKLTLRPLDRVSRTAHSVTDLPLGTGEVQLPARLLNNAPGTEVGRVTGAVNSMLEHIESALTERQTTETLLRQFVADASHEFRTPLAVIRSHAEYAHMTGHDLGAEVELALTRISAESVRMGALVDDLLLLARLDSGRALGHVAVDLTRLVLDAVIDAQTLGADHHWQLDLPEREITVTGDENPLRQVVVNLLANAVEHTPAGTGVSVSLTHDARSAVLIIADNGPGIAAEVLPHVFERFVRADSAREHTSGESGLGLAIVDAITRAHSGTVTVTSEPGRTAFTVRLPLLQHDAQSNER
ncbi:MAG: two-component sensor histidine kinase [Frankiales bacterium]|nr:two-component sensor histidine kinase [Frankiales bacterium]